MQSDLRRLLAVDRCREPVQPSSCLLTQSRKAHARCTVQQQQCSSSGDASHAYDKGDEASLEARHAVFRGGRCHDCSLQYCLPCHCSCESI